MILIAESGSTKCNWLYTDGTTTTQVRTHGINAMLHTPEQIDGVIDALPTTAPIEAIHFYGAGCGPHFAEASNKVRTALTQHFGINKIEIQSDLLAAARALHGRGEGIACILGTGSNSCHTHRGEIVDNVPPLGYILGDEGSGATLGRNLLNGIFKGHIPLREELLKTLGITYPQIIRRVYTESFANRFLASLAPFIRTHMECPEVRQMVVDSFCDFARRNLHRYPASLPIGFVGGIAAHFEEPLREAMQHTERQIETIIESPAEGLVKFHYGA